MYTKLNFFVRIENGIYYFCNNDDDRWRIAKRLKFGVKIIRELGYIYIYIYIMYCVHQGTIV